MVRKLVIALASVAGFLVAAAALLWALQGQLIFPVPAGAQLPERREALLRLASPQGEVVALHLPAAPGSPTLVLFHGNGEELADIESWAAALNRRGLGALAVEYPGYGLARSSGPPGEEACYRAAEVALAHLRETLGVPVAQTVLVGHSLGSAVAAEMALRGRGARLVLLSPITSIADEARMLVPVVPVGLLVRHRFDTFAKAPRIGVPTLIVHGDHDEVAPVEGGRRLSRALPDARLIEVPGGEHMIIPPRLEELAGCVDRFARGGECGRL